MIDVINFRDVGESVNLLSGNYLLVEKKLFRGGSLNNIFDPDEMVSIEAIINLRVGPDRKIGSLNSFHIPAPNNIDNYSTTGVIVRRWLIDVLRKVSNNLASPLLIHCSAGRDRTGIVVALILFCLGISEELIIEEYSQSSGVKDTSFIVGALNGFRSTSNYVQDDRVVSHLRSSLLI